jgi:hypothetical protein
MKKRVLKPYMPKGKGPYFKWAKRGGIKKDWLAIIQAFFSFFHLPIVGYYLCGEDGKGVVFTVLSLMVFILVNYSPEVELWMVAARYALWFYPIYDVYMTARAHMDRYRFEYEKKYGVSPY